LWKIKLLYEFLLKIYFSLLCPLLKLFCISPHTLLLYIFLWLLSSNTRWDYHHFEDIFFTSIMKLNRSLLTRHIASNMYNKKRKRKKSFVKDFYFPVCIWGFQTYLGRFEVSEPWTSVCEQGQCLLNNFLNMLLSEMEGVDLINIYCKHLCKCHNAPPVQL
jgi:hypothetical protein